MTVRLSAWPVHCGAIVAFNSVLFLYLVKSYRSLISLILPVIFYLFWYLPYMLFFLLITFKALNGLLCADVPLRNYSLTHSRIVVLRVGVWVESCTVVFLEGHFYSLLRTLSLHAVSISLVTKYSDLLKSWQESNADFRDQRSVAILYVVHSAIGYHSNSWASCSIVACCTWDIKITHI